ncbi:unnamed protein product [Fraxinus pennsylvanica]|uniref:Guanosine nucleotide diphosphate dissociation inhibitor n=1 Tax=Fraxinus pennsylvanica TaxID=56036 RepID=A0AAD1ZX28_9LAMI|nr:unnamed protein product [Fraxinus pennsylvanica]
MDEEYDVIVLGTGLKECILSGLLSVDRLKVLHMDRNDYYGGESTSLNLVQLWKRFRGSDNPPTHLDSIRDYNVDMIPKFIMANGALLRVLIHTNVTKYLNFKSVDGSYVYSKGKVHKVPATDMEALKSPLMGIFEKRRARKFFIYVQEYDENVPKTHEGMDLTRVTTRELVAYLFCCSYSHNVAPKGKFIAFVSTEAETDQPEIELKPGVDLLGPVDEIFFETYDRYEPANEPAQDNCFISTSYDSTTHFESTVDDVLNMYTKITGKVLDLNVDLSAASDAEE